MSDPRVFEFKGNALITFRVALRPTFLTVSTTRKKGGEAAKTWDVSFTALESIRITERIGARTRSSALFLKPRSGALAMFAWQKNVVGASEKDKELYYAAAIASLHAIAEERPDLNATFGPDGRSALIGAGLGAVAFIGVAYLGIGALNATFLITASAIVAVYAFSAARSGAFEPPRTVSLAEATSKLQANAAR